MEIKALHNHQNALPEASRRRLFTKPSPNTAISVWIAHPTLPESSIFAPFGTKSRPKARLERHQKTSQKKTLNAPFKNSSYVTSPSSRRWKRASASWKSNSSVLNHDLTVTKMESQKGDSFEGIRYFWDPKRHPEGSRRCPRHLERVISTGYKYGL